MTMTARSKVDWTPEVLAGLLAKREAGASAAKLAEHFHVGVTTIYTSLVRARSLRDAKAQAAKGGRK
jgi:transposase